MAHSVVVGDPSLRLKNGCAQDDASTVRDMLPVAFPVPARILALRARIGQLQSTFDVMRKAALLYNPDSGTSRRGRRELESAVAILRNAGVEAELVPTESRKDGGQAARRAVANGCDTLFACGGDGTINNIMQAVVNTPVALAILPMGTANALAHDLGLPLKISAAVEAALHARLRRVTPGQIKYLNLEGEPRSRYFIVAAGMGADAYMFYALRSGDKQRLGMSAYYAKTAVLWFTYPMPRFAVEYTATGSDSAQRAEITELLSVRIRNFGGVAGELAPGASLDRDDMRLIVARTASRFTYLGYVARCLLRQNWSIPGVDLVHATKAVCSYLPGTEQEKIYVEADGELVGTLPAEITVAPNALTLLAP
jgi:diacylglycerol kinase (ATP)